MTTLQYLDKVPKSIPPDARLVHRPTRLLGRGFRAWLVTLDTEGLEPCSCGWAPELGEHFRVRRRWETAKLPSPRRRRSR